MSNGNGDYCSADCDKLLIIGWLAKLRGIPIFKFPLSGIIPLWPDWLINSCSFNSAHTDVVHGKSTKVSNFALPLTLRGV